MPRVILAGGGTGGHLYPMLAIADALVQAGLPAHNIRLVGSSRGEDRRILSGSPFRVSLWPGRGIRRSVSLGAIFANVRALFGITGAFALGVVTALTWRPSVVVSVGGYASLPMSIGAVITRRPLILVELDAATGLAHRLVLRFATKRCTAFEDIDPRAIVTGAPVRQELVKNVLGEPIGEVSIPTLTAPAADSQTVVLAMTGSLGARSVNDAVAELARLWRDRRDVVLIQVTGRRDFGRIKEQAESAALDYRIVEFADMTILWPLADVAICRAGATTVAELGVVGVPAILVPLPHSPSNHQEENARAVAAVGAAMVIDDSLVSGASLAASLEPLLQSPRRTKMASAMKSLGRPHAARDIATVVLEVANL